MLIPNTYLVTFEDAQNGDYQDYVFLVTTCVAPVGSTGTGTPVAKVDFQPGRLDRRRRLHRATPAPPSPRPAASAGCSPAPAPRWT